MSPRSCLLLAAALFITSCDREPPTAPTPTPLDTGPAATSVAGALRRFAWAWNHSDTTSYRALFTDDFLFVFAANDSAGTPWPGHCWPLPDERRAARHLFAGGGTLPPANRVVVTIDHVLVPRPDPRPGMNGRWHQTVRTHVDVKVTATRADGTPAVTPIIGMASFYLVRGDSAAIGGQAAGATPDSTHWYIQRWEDETVGALAPGLHPLPARSWTWGSLKALYWN